MLSLASCLVLATSAIEADPPNGDGVQLDPKRVSWRQLEFKASKLFVSATTRVELGQVAPGVAEVSLETKALGRKTTDSVRFQLADARTLERRKRKHGNKPYAKLYRFQPNGVTMERSEPANIDEATGNDSSWSRRKSETFELPPASCSSVVDPSVVLYLAAAKTWRLGAPPYSVCTFSQGKFSRLVIDVAGQEEIRVEYESEDSDGRSERRSGTVRAWVLELAAKSFQGSEQDQLEILGLEEDVRMYVDPQTGAPVRFAGKMDKLGRVEIRLQRLVER